MPKAWPNLNLDQLVENDKLAERGRGWAECVPSLFFERWDKWNSPYINHFISPDTIIPNPYTSQSWNRYAYVNNNPITAIDPTGHQCVGEPEECLEDDRTTGPGFPGGGGSPGAGNCSGAGCQGEDDNNPSSNDVCDQILGCEDPDAGVFCDQYGCWYDADTDISGTFEDPAVYISLAAGGWVSGLISDIGWLGLYNCLRLPSCARIIASTTGITVYRVWGGNPNQPGVGYSGPYGPSWTPIPPNLVERLFGTAFRNIAGLPDINNMGRFLSTGTISDISVVSEIQSATAILPNTGGLLEYIIYNAQNAINLTGVQGVNPPF